MDQKIFEKFLSTIARWSRVDEHKIYRKPDEVDPDHHNPQIEIDEMFQRTYPCDWCEKRTCTGRRSIQRMEDPTTKETKWALFCNTCKNYWNPETKKLSMNPFRQVSRPGEGARGRPKKPDGP